MDVLAFVGLVIEIEVGAVVELERAGDDDGRKARLVRLVIVHLIVVGEPGLRRLGRSPRLRASLFHGSGNP